MSRLSREQQGSALVTAIILMSIMLSVGLATLAIGAGQRDAGTRERIHESAFSLAEGALNTQMFLLSRSWPGSSSTAYPANCSSSTTVTNCPDPQTLRNQYADVEYSGASWATAVQDNGGAAADFYSTSAAATQPHWDANGDGKVWVRAQATASGATRTVVIQVRGQIVSIPFPRNVVTAGHFMTSNNGNKVIVDTNGGTYASDPAQPAPLAVRCNAPPQSACLNYDPSKGQVSPPVYETSYPTTSVLTADQLNSMRGIARDSGTYYASGCPGSLTGALVFIESGNCSYGGGVFNSQGSPGMVVIASGTLSLGGNATYYGLVYAANLQNSTGDVISLTGTSEIIGSVAVDNQGGFLAGSSGTNIAFLSTVFSVAKGYGESAPVKGSWREL